MLRGIWRNGWISLLLITGILVLMFMPVADVYDIVLTEADIQDNHGDGVLIVAKGANLLRVNSFYLDDERIEDCIVSRVTYEECHILVDRGILGEFGTWHKLELGFSWGGILNLIGSPIWIEWKLP